MPIKIESQPNDIYTLHVSGIAKQAEFSEAQVILGRGIESGAKPRLLALLENFEGWERGADWNDLDFLFKYSNEIAKIAIVGDPRWEPQSLAFAGAGFRAAPVNFFPPDQIDKARRWLTE